MSSTLAEKRSIEHPLSGHVIKTPILLPSFSSKGFDKRDIETIWKMANSEILHSNYILISAYDYANKIITEINPKNFEVVYVDSGGYETSDFEDLSSVQKKSKSCSSTWDKTKLKSIYDELSKKLPAIFVSYDNYKEKRSIKDQIKDAKELLKGYDQLKTILLKAENKDKIDIHEVETHIKELRSFDIIGFTEKELGNSLLSRMESIAKIRIKLKDEDINKPIHIFGSLDPISSCLYFLAGADIFDGLTWLRYGYNRSESVYKENYYATQGWFSEPIENNYARLIAQNHIRLNQIETQMHTFTNEEDYNSFEENSELFRKCFERLKSNIRRIGGEAYGR